MVDRETSKAEVENLFSQGRVLYYSDVVKELQIDLELVVELCNELISEGKIEKA